MQKIDLVVIGNAIVDILYQSDEQFLVTHQMQKGVMTLIDEETARKIYTNMDNPIKCSGGSAANTAVGFSWIGGVSGFIGRVGNDLLGKYFIRDIRESGVYCRMSTKSMDLQAATAQSMIIVTPDTKRTMQTYLGAGAQFSASDLDVEMIQAGRFLFLEGYLWDAIPTKMAMREAATIAKGSGNQIALSLSDPICVQRHRQSFHELIDNQIDILFANQEEICSLFETSDLSQAVDASRGRCSITCITRGPEGSLILKGDHTYEITACPALRIIDSTGAGDEYAAGVLYGLCRKQPIQSCGELGSIMAAEVLGHLGARPATKRRETALGLG